MKSFSSFARAAISENENSSLYSFFTLWISHNPIIFFKNLDLFSITLASLVKFSPYDFSFTIYPLSMPIRDHVPELIYAAVPSSPEYGTAAMADAVSCVPGSITARFFTPSSLCTVLLIFPTVSPAFPSFVFFIFSKPVIFTISSSQKPVL